MNPGARVAGNGQEFSSLRSDVVGTAPEILEMDVDMPAHQVRMSFPGEPPL